MRKHVKRTNTGSLLQTRRFQVIGVVAVVIVFAMAAMGISMRAGKAENGKGELGKSSPANSSRGTSLPLRSAQDGQTYSQAQIRPLTQQEAQQMAEGIKSLVNQSTEGLKQVQHADGSVSMDLQGRFQNVALAKKTDDGKVVQSCVDNPESAAAFFGINRELIDGKKSDPSKTRQPVQQPESGMHGKEQN